MNKAVVGIVVTVLALGTITGIIIVNKSNNKATPATEETSRQAENKNVASDNNTDLSATNDSSENTSTVKTVSISSFAFSPQKLTVKKGTTVTWTNQDPTAHTVTADSGTSFDSGVLASGATYTYTFDTVGIYTYHCEIHSSMKGTVEVTE